MFRETVILTKPVTRVSSLVAIEEISENVPDQSVELPAEKPLQKDDPVSTAEAEKIEPETLEHHPEELLREQNEVLLQIKEILMSVEKAVIAHQQEQKAALEKVFEKVPKVAFSIAEKVVHKKIEMDQKLIVNTIKQVLKTSEEKKKLTIILNPKDIHVIQSVAPEFGLDRESMEKYWQFEKDEQITPGGCLIKTSNEEIDARVESQLKALEESILNMDY